MIRNIPLAFCALALSLAGAATAASQRNEARKEASSVAVPNTARAATFKPERDSAKGDVNADVYGRATKDPYATPLLLNAKPIR